MRNHARYGQVPQLVREDGTWAQCMALPLCAHGVASTTLSRPGWAVWRLADVEAGSALGPVVDPGILFAPELPDLVSQRGFAERQRKTVTAADRPDSSQS